MRKLVNFFELPEGWQKEAISNNGDLAKEIVYIKPLKSQTPSKHALLDLSECMRCDDERFDGIIGISNNSAIGVKLSIDLDKAELTYL